MPPDAFRQLHKHECIGVSWPGHVRFTRPASILTPGEWRCRHTAMVTVCTVACDRLLFCCAATVYSPLGGVDQGSIYKRGGRFSPEFLWNTNWQDQVGPLLLVGTPCHAAELFLSCIRAAGPSSCHEFLNRVSSAAASPATWRAGALGTNRILGLDRNLLSKPCSWRLKRMWNGSGWRQRGRTRSRPPATSASAASST